MYYTRIFLFVKFSGHGESWEWLSIGYWREVRGEEGKGYNSLRSDKCHRFSNAATRELRGSQIPGSCTPVRTLTAGGGIAGIF